MLLRAVLAVGANLVIVGVAAVGPVPRWNGHSPLIEPRDWGGLSTPELWDAWEALPHSDDSRTARRTKTPKLAVLLLTKDQLNNAHVWSRWIRQARQDRLDFRLFIHAYGLPESGFFKTASFRKFLVDEVSPSSWGNAFGPIMLLMRRALDDPGITHVVTACQATVPLKPLRWMYRELRRDSRTRMCVDRQCKIHETWFLMRREDASVFSEHEDLLTLAFLGGTGCGKKCVVCSQSTDERMFYLPLSIRRTPVAVQCITFADWEGSEFCRESKSAAWCQLREPFRCKNLFDANHAEFTPAGATNDGRNHHPSTFHSLDADAYRELLESPFWFARKFDDGSISREVIKSTHSVGVNFVHLGHATPHLSSGQHSNYVLSRQSCSWMTDKSSPRLANCTQKKDNPFRHFHYELMLVLHQCWQADAFTLGFARIAALLGIRIYRRQYPHIVRWKRRSRATGSVQ